MSTNDAYVYDVLRIINGKILFFDDHYARLVDSLTRTNCTSIPDKEQVRSAIMKCLKENGIENDNVKLMYKDGITLLPLTAHYPTAEMYAHGVPCDLFEAARKNPQAKVNNQALRDATNAFIEENHLFEAILVSEGVISEGSRSTIFFIKDDTIYTAPLEGVLPGITRKHIVQVCEAENIPLKESEILADSLDQYDAAFIGGTSPKVLPIKNIGSINYNPDNKTLRKLMKAFDTHIESET